MRWLLYIFLITIVSVFAISLRNFHRLPEEPKNWKIYSPKINNIRFEIIEKFEKKYNLELSGFIDGMPQGIIHKIGVLFNRYQVTSKAKARRIIVECVQDFLEKINSCEELQPYLYDYPFTVKNIDIMIFMYNADGTPVFYPNLDRVGIDKDKLIYSTIKPEKPNDDIEEEEFFEEALELVKTEIPQEDLS